MRQHHGIKAGDLVKFKYDMFENLGAVHLVTKAWTRSGPSGIKYYLHLHDGGGLHHRANNFVVISKARKREV